MSDFSMYPGLQSIDVPGHITPATIRADLVIRDVRLVTITPAQARVLRELLNDGASNVTIARRLRVSTESVKSHTKALFRHFGVSNRAALVVEVLTGRQKYRVEDGNLTRKQ